MTRIRALAVICLLIVLIGSSVHFAVGDSFGNAEETSKQITAPNEPASPPNVQVLPKEPLISWDQSTSFFVRIENADGGGVLICLQDDIDTDVKFEFLSNDVKPLTLPPFREVVCPGADKRGYIPKKEVGEVKSIPVSLSSDERFPVGENNIIVETHLKNSRLTVVNEFIFRVACPIDCRLSLLWAWTVQNLDRIVAVLSLLIAFFGRKKIWAVLRVPRRHVASTVGSKQKRDVDTEDGERNGEK